MQLNLKNSWGYRSRKLYIRTKTSGEKNFLGNFNSYNFFGDGNLLMMSCFFWNTFN